MPGADFRESEPTFADSLVPLLGAHWDTWLGGVANIVTLPASFLLSLAIVAWRSRLLAVVLLAAVAVEVVCKELIERPALYDGAFHISAFDSSFPSGHTLRTMLVAAAVWPLLPRLGGRVGGRVDRVAAARRLAHADRHRRRACCSGC